MILYTRNHCSACDAIKKRLKAKNIEYTEANIEDDMDAGMRLVHDGIRSVPVLELDDGMRFIGGAAIATQV